jgi:protein-tyrosine phosphatase
MIDLHCHLLPRMDDGPSDLATALQMARIASADGIAIAACTPHVMPGLYDNDGPAIRAAVWRLSDALRQEGLPLQLVPGADIHFTPDLLPRLRDGRIPTIHGSRYMLVEPPRQLPPPRLETRLFSLMTAGYFPILTHPERLDWIESHYELLERLAKVGVWMQITAGSLCGRFGRRTLYWAERLLDEGRVHCLATDAHDAVARPPVLAEARERAARRLGEAEADNLVLVRPRAVLDDREPKAVPSPPGAAAGRSHGGWLRLFQRRAG